MFALVMIISEIRLTYVFRRSHERRLLELYARRNAVDLNHNWWGYVKKHALIANTDS